RAEGNGEFGGPPISRCGIAFVRCTRSVGRSFVHQEAPIPDPAERRNGGLNVVAVTRDASGAAEAVLAEATAAVRGRVMVEDRVIERSFDREQRAVHGLAWLATYVESLRQLAGYAERMQASLGEIEQLLVLIGTGEYLAQIAGGIPMSQGEIVRPADLGLSSQSVAARMRAALEPLPPSPHP